MVLPPNFIPHWVAVAVVVVVAWIATNDVSVYTPDEFEVPIKTPWATLLPCVYLGWWIIYNLGVLPIPGCLPLHQTKSRYLQR